MRQKVDKRHHLLYRRDILLYSVHYNYKEKHGSHIRLLKRIVFRLYYLVSKNG